MPATGDVAAFVLCTPSPYVAICGQDVIYPTPSNIDCLIYKVGGCGWCGAIFSVDHAVPSPRRQVR